MDLEISSKEQALFIIIKSYFVLHIILRIGFGCKHGLV